MLGAIPNPKRTLTINFPIERIKETIEFLPSLNNTYKFTSKNEILNLYTFEALEFLSLGVYIDFILNKIDDAKTEITVEVRRKVGAFDQSFEVTKANQHISNMFDLISKCITLTPEQITQFKTTASAQVPNKGCLVLMLIAGAVVISPFLYFLIH